MILKASYAKIEQAERQAFAKWGQQVDQELMTTLAEKKSIMEKKIADANRDAANRSAIINGLGGIASGLGGAWASSGFSTSWLGGGAASSGGAGAGTTGVNVGAMAGEGGAATSGGSTAASGGAGAVAAPAMIAGTGVLVRVGFTAGKGNRPIAGKLFGSNSSGSAPRSYGRDLTPEERKALLWSEEQDRVIARQQSNN
jgi:hypothetical protein